MSAINKSKDVKSKDAPLLFSNLCWMTSMCFREFSVPPSGQRLHSAESLADSADSRLHSLLCTCHKLGCSGPHEDEVTACILDLSRVNMSSMAYGTEHPQYGFCSFKTAHPPASRYEITRDLPRVRKHPLQPRHGLSWQAEPCMTATTSKPIN